MHVYSHHECEDSGVRMWRSEPEAARNLYLRELVDQLSTIHPSITEALPFVLKVSLEASEKAEERFILYVEELGSRVGDLWAPDYLDKCDFAAVILYVYIPSLAKDLEEMTISAFKYISSCFDNGYEGKNGIPILDPSISRKIWFTC